VNLPDLIILALVDGVADVLPIDASAHALLASRLLGWRAGPVGAALHFGAALALMIFLWRDCALIAAGLWKLRKLRLEPGTRLLTKVLFTAAPLALVKTGLLGPVVPAVNGLLLVGLITLLGALAMLLADRFSLTVKRIEHIGVGTIVAVGLLQLLSLIAGVGRVAIAVTVTRLFGMERQEAYRFTLLVSVPVLLIQAGSEFVENSRNGNHFETSSLLAGGITLALVLAALPLAFSLIRRAGLVPFVLYRVLFGVVLVGFGLL